MHVDRDVNPPTVADFSLSKVGANNRQETFEEVRKINKTLEGWDVGTDVIKRRYLKPLKEEQKEFLLFKIARVAKTAVGYVIVEHRDRSSAYISFIAVKYENQGKNIGSTLMEEAIRKAKKKGYEKLSLECEYDRAAFYIKFAEKRKFSYKIIGKPGNGCDFILNFDEDL